MLVEQYSRRQRVQADREPIRMAARDVEHALARAVPPMSIRRQRQVADAGCIVVDESPIVRIERADEEPPQALAQIRRLANRGEPRLDDHASQVTIRQRLDRNGRLDRQPSAPSMPRRVDAEPREPAMDGAMAAVL